MPVIEENTPDWAEPIPWNGLNLEASPEEIAEQKRVLDRQHLEELLEKRRHELEETERLWRELNNANELPASTTTVAYRE